LFKLLKNLVLVLVVGVLAYHFRAPLRETMVPAWQSAKVLLFPLDACEEPIPYVLGNFDTDFKISKVYFLDALAEAEAIWEKPSGMNLFNYEPDNTEVDALKVNLVYDYRQQATSTLASLGITVKNTQASYDSLKSKFLSLKASYEKLKSSFEVSVSAFNTKNQVYEKDVKYWNGKGGAPKSEYEKLEVIRLALEREAKALRATQDRLAEMVDEINAMVVVLNRLAAALNISVDRYNAINVERGESFEEGIYSSDGIERKINIYEFSSRAKLVRVLAHELGHALDLAHVADKEAIMYELNEGDSLKLTETDLNALKTECEK
jgi:hypothetical protein